jgi:hypothetical protein
VKLAVSTIIPTYNRERLVQRAIRSALAAMSPGDEVIVIDDGSTDDTVQVVERFGPPVRLLRRPHAGAGPTRNAGVEAARGPLIAFLDSDDEWHPDKIDLQRALFEARPDLLFTFSTFGVYLADGSSVHDYLPHWMVPPRPYEEVFGPGVPYSSIAPLPAGREDFQVRICSMYAEEMRNNLITAFTFMGRKEGTVDAMRFADDLPTGEEWQAFGRLAKLGPGAFMETETAWQYGHGGDRLSAARLHVTVDAWLRTMERVWGQDQDFLTTHGAEYQEVRAVALRMKATSLARHGRLMSAAHSILLAGGIMIAAKTGQVLSLLFPGGPTA